MEEHELMQAETQGNEANVVVENPAFRAAFDMLEKDLTYKWKTSPAEDQAGRERAWQMVFLLQAVQANLESLILTGKMARTRRQQMLERLKRSLPEWITSSDRTSIYE